MEDKEKHGSIDKETLRTNIMIHYLSNLFVIGTPLTSKESLKSLKISVIDYVKYFNIYLQICMFVCMCNFKNVSGEECKRIMLDIKN